MLKKEVFELVETSAEYAANLYNGLEKIIADLREDKVRSGLTDLAQAIEGVEWLTGAVLYINDAVGESQFDIETAKEFFSEMIEATENMDFVLLTDLIEYEILPIIDAWGIKLDKILENA